MSSFCVEENGNLFPQSVPLRKLGRLQDSCPAKKEMGLDSLSDLWDELELLVIRGAAPGWYSNLCKQLIG
jgi:hypothetical protein